MDILILIKWITMNVPSSSLMVGIKVCTIVRSNFVPLWIHRMLLLPSSIIFYAHLISSQLHARAVDEYLLCRATLLEGVVQLR